VQFTVYSELYGKKKRWIIKLKIFCQSICFLLYNITVQQIQDIRLDNIEKILNRKKKKKCNFELYYRNYHRQVGWIGLWMHKI
jgi:hypothetical protein